MPLEFDPGALNRVMAGLKHDLAETIVNQYGHDPIPYGVLRSDILNAGVMGTFDHFSNAVQSASDDREIQILTSSGRSKRPGAVLSKNDRILVPETPPLLILMGLELPK